MEHQARFEGDQFTLTLSGRITYQDHVTFRSFIETIDSGDVKKVSIELAKADFIDSAGLGMLLLLRDAVSQRQGRVSLVRPQGQVQRLIDTSRFSALFDVLP